MENIYRLQKIFGLSLILSLLIILPVLHYHISGNRNDFLENKTDLPDKIEETGIANLPETKIFREAFQAGWLRYLKQYANAVDFAGDLYRRGPVAMARLIHEHGGGERSVATAACLAGPAVFSEHPAQWLDLRLVEFSREIRGVGTTPPQELYGRIPGLSDDARVFRHASAIMLMEQVAEQPPQPDQYRTDTEALD